MHPNTFLSQRTIRLAWKLRLAAMAVVLVLAAPELAYSSRNAPTEVVLCAATGWFTGNTAKAISAIALGIIGIWTFLGKIAGKVALVTAVGIVVLFGLAALMNALGTGGSGAGSCT